MGADSLLFFVSVRYFYNPSVKDKFIKPYMAEATAIFPFFSGANGLWLWDDPLNHNRDENFGLYEHFINGLYRLSLYKNMFEGNYELVIPTPARDYNDTQKPIWRGVFKDNNLLVAAHNPYAKSDNDVVTVPVAYKNWQGSVTLKGYEVFLCKFDLSLTSNEPSG
ncbi:MAG: T9SS C-terminal target domain-containing protein, partial [Spirosomaceae bacterium]|nr:T9SS C-terminal target domain-containing protein [Spirosomataceae bacterium]